MIYGNEGCGRETHTARGAAECCMGLETTTRVPVNYVLNDTNAHYVFYCDLAGSSELGPAAVAGCFLAKAHHPRAAETNACCAATRSR